MNELKQKRGSAGFTLLELLVAMALTVIILTMGAQLYKQASMATNLLVVRAEMQQNARSAINTITRELSVAGTGLPSGGIQLPDGAGATPPVFACDTTSCYIASNAFLNAHLYAVMPGFQKGLTVGPNSTSIVTLAYMDSSLTLNSLPLTNFTPSGSQITFDPSTPKIADPAVGLKVGDLIMVYNTNGAAMGVITGLPQPNKVDFATSDPLNINQPSASHGNLASILSGGTAATLPTSAVRINLVTYFLQPDPGPDGMVGTADDGAPRLMRQLNTSRPIPVAENIQNLQFSYDIFDDSTSTASSNLGDANLKYNQIRKINIVVAVRSATRDPQTGQFQSLTLATSVSPRNLSFRDRYQ
jgi:prepilin-type N-terminal cleavage/methylation domain-containing protein